MNLVKSRESPLIVLRGEDYVLGGFKLVLAGLPMMLLREQSTLLARGGMGEIFRWFFRILIYDIIVTSIAEVLGVSRLVALFIFLGIMLAIGAIGYIMKQKYSPDVE